MLTLTLTLNPNIITNPNIDTNPNPNPNIDTNPNPNPNIDTNPNLNTNDIKSISVLSKFQAVLFELALFNEREREREREKETRIRTQDEIRVWTASARRSEIRVCRGGRRSSDGDHQPAQRKRSPPT